ASKEEFPKEKASKEESSASVNPTKKDSKSKGLTAAQKKEIESFIESLSNPSRRRRQEAAHEIAEIAQTAPEAFEGRVEDLIDALYRPEAQTRWEILAALASLSESYGNEVIKAFDGAEASLFDDTSSTVRLAAFLFLTRYGATSQKHSDQAWPLLNEAIQCYHGDAEYYDMLVGTLNFAKGAVSKETKAALKERFAFDAENATGYIQKFSAEIVAAAQ
ncbi:HEAT repeat domain-containing protein, partial [Lancefieldella rimae]|uniref:HEAT repeat domain-containing protein n=1 Tax=Lancefieldella rimae TaxID=1383 RepID=UPI003C6F37F3